MSRTLSFGLNLLKSSYYLKRAFTCQYLRIKVCLAIIEFMEPVFILQINSIQNIDQKAEGQK